jgi:two-component system response regulator GlrR
MENLHQLNPEMPVIILTAYGTIESAVEAMRKGAYTYITKPFNYDELLIQTKNCLEKTKLTKEIKSLKKVVKNRFGFDSIIGRSQKMEEVLEQVTKAADSDSTIIIEGESGTGKELIAQTLHLASPRADKPFVAINCAAIPETLFESEMFGYEKGAFTGAVQNKEGLMFQAQGGTFFLDEISEMPLSMQVKLLRVMQEKEFFPVGGTKTIKMDIRFIASTNKNLKEEVKKSTFREDLFYRIHVIDIHLPPLRERQGDIPVLSHYFLDKLSKDMNKNITGFSTTALQKLMLHTWPGNVRELQNTIESAITMANEDIISDDLILPTLSSEVNDLKPLKDAKENFEKNYLLQLIELTEGNMAQAARLAGKYRADLYELLKKYGLKPSTFRKKQ